MMATTRRALMGGAAMAALTMLLRPLRAMAAASQQYEVMRSDAQWHAMLTPDQYHILRQAGTEQPFSSALLHEKRDGIFACAGCALPVFSSKWKYDSHTGWPSFWTAIDNSLRTSEDHTLPVLRTELHCRRCGSHLGHVFDDGPPPTGLRYCMDGLALTFIPI